MRNPFIAGSWVRGDNFFGRSDILRDILEGARDSLWVVGARRLGKTSLLKELERRVQAAPQTPFVPLYWDLQGSADARGLADNLLGSVEDSEAFRRATDIGGRGPRGAAGRRTCSPPCPPHRAQRLAPAAAGGRGRGVPGRGAHRRRSSCPACAASSRRGPRCARSSPPPSASPASTSGPTSPPRPSCWASSRPLYLTPLAADEARALLGARPVRRRRDRADPGSARPAIRSCVQLIASRLFETHDLAATLDQVAADEMVANFFSVDFQTLDPEERTLLEEVARDGDAQPPGPRAGAAAHRGRHRAAALRPAADGLPGGGRTAPSASATGSSTAGCARVDGGGAARDRRGQPGRTSTSGREYHIQAEDLGVEQAVFEVRVYDGGAVLWHKRVPYARDPGEEAAAGRAGRGAARAHGEDDAHGAGRHRQGQADG